MWRLRRKLTSKYWTADCLYIDLRSIFIHIVERKKTARQTCDDVSTTSLVVILSALRFSLSLKQVPTFFQSNPSPLLSFYKGYWLCFDCAFYFPRFTSNECAIYRFASTLVLERCRAGWRKCMHISLHTLENLDVIRRRVGDNGKYACTLHPAEW